MFAFVKYLEGSLAHHECSLRVLCLSHTYTKKGEK